MTNDVEFPSLRAEVIGALRSLSDVQYQRERWGQYDPSYPDFYDDLDMNIHILYDDTMVLPEPESAVPAILHEWEVPALRRVSAVLSPMLHDLGDASQAVYMNDRRWGDVVVVARDALAVMLLNPESRGT